MDSHNQARFDRLYNAHVEELRLSGKAASSLASYSFALTRLSRFVDRCPDDLSIEELRRYFTTLLAEHSWSLVKIERAAIRFFYQRILGVEMPWLGNIKPPSEVRIPDDLTRDDVARLIRETRDPSLRAFWLVTYTLGLRLGEALSLRVTDIDSTRMHVTIHAGKGRKDRRVILPQVTLQALRNHYRTHRHPVFLFPSPLHPNDPERHMSEQHVQAAFRKVLAGTGIRKRATIHSLRHAYATHLIELGLSLRAVQDQLGHVNLQTTARYVRISEAVLHESQARINVLADPLGALFPTAPKRRAEA